jgi:hypothetical protein
MADQYAIVDLPLALEAKQFPTITTWNRVEGRPVTVDFNRALRAEVRDALWMLTRQWQMGELNGEDAGSPASMRASITTTRLTRFQAGAAPARDFDDALPFETQVERRPVKYSIGIDKVALNLRLLLGRRWLRQIKGIGDYGDLFAAKYSIELPDATRREDASVCAHAEVLQGFHAAAGRAMDGVNLYQYLKDDASRHAYDGVVVFGTHKGPLDIAAGKFLSWADNIFSQPEGPADNPAWNPERLEYRFACSAPDPDPNAAGAEKTYVADEYYQGTLDWYDLDVVPDNGLPLGPSDDVSAADPRGSITRTMLPVPLSFPGMPNPRWWTIEDRQTNFGAIRPDTTDLAKLLLIEFGLVYSNDWFIIPFTLPAGGIARMQALTVTDVFGDRYWIDAAGAGADANWQRWSFLTVSAAERAPVPRAFDPARRDRAASPKADTALLFLPTVPKVQESAPHEDVRFMRDEMAGMVWAIEKVIPAPDGRGRSGDVAARDTRAYHERLVAAQSSTTPPALLVDNDARVRYDLMSTVPENWIPFISVRARGSNRAIDLQRASTLRNIEGDSLAPAKVKPRTSLLRTGLDQNSPAIYLVPEEEVPRAGVVVMQSWQRTRGPDGRVHTWIGVRKRVGRGEGSSGLAFDRLIDLPLKT